MSRFVTTFRKWRNPNHRRLTTTQDVLESSPEFDGHGVVQDGVDGAVNVYHDATEQEKPGIAVFSGREGVVDNHDPVWHPENGEHSKNNYKHSDHLQQNVNCYQIISL